MFETFVTRDRETQGASECFEDRFDLMMRRTAVDDFQVNIGARSLREALEKVLGKFGLKFAQKPRGEFCVANAIRAPTEVDRSGGKRFVHRDEEIAGTQDTAFVADGFQHGFAEGDAGVFHGMVLIDIQVAIRLQREIECAVTRDEIEHVIEKANASGDAGRAFAVEIQTEVNVSLVGFAMNRGGPRHYCFQ
jgi:hypothetical protein